MWKDDSETHPAVVQSVNAVERTAIILLEDGRRERVSVLEIDSHGAQADVSNLQDAFGVRRGDSIFIHPEGSDNGCQKPMVPRCDILFPSVCNRCSPVVISSIGEIEPWVRDTPLPMPDHGKLEGWLGELDAIGQSIAQSEQRENHKVGRFSPADGRLRWFGEVTDVSPT